MGDGGGKEGCQAVWEALCPAGLGRQGSSLVVEPGKGWASCPGCEVQAGAADSLSGTEPWASQMELSSVRFFQIRTGVVFLRRPILSALPLTSPTLATGLFSASVRWLLRRNKDRFIRPLFGISEQVKSSGMNRGQT